MQVTNAALLDALNDSIVFLVLLANIAGVNVGLVVLEALAILGGAFIVQRGAAGALADIFDFHIGCAVAIVVVALAAFCVARHSCQQSPNGEE